MLSYKFIGHCYEPSEHHDKVWGAIDLEPDSKQGSRKCKVLTFWGRRGKKLSTKLVTDSDALYKLIRSKENKGYQSINKNRLDEVYPEFEEDLEKTAMWAMLKL